ncbi:MAG: Holliday junction branch migration protein RuvA [Desulfarculus sp.]|nr:Holliday junction branch migration protein RuvA [Desulfarculus sp.]
MIARLRGTLLERRPDQVVLDVAGVGYRLFISLGTFYDLPEPGQPLDLLVHTVVRDDAIHLYGFLRPQERSAFHALIAVTGVGPKLALGILSGIAPDDLWMAVRGRDAERLTKVPGVGKKTAARLVVELEGKIPALAPGAAALPPSAAPGRPPAVEDAISALINLGYPESAAAKAVEGAAKALEGQPTVETLLRAALSRFR